MKRLFLLTLIFVTPLGCQPQNQRPRVDPFHGRQVVEPPCVTPGRSPPDASYYNRPPDYLNQPGGTPSSSNLQTPAQPLSTVRGQGLSSTGAASGKDTPSSGWVAAGAKRDEKDTPRPFVADRPLTEDLKTAATTPAEQGPRPESGVAKVAQREPIVRILPRRPDRARTTAKAVDIMDLPEPSPVRRASATKAGTGSWVVPAAATAEETGEQVVPAAEFTPSGQYGHGQRYGWIRGKLDYSQLDEQWMLHYIAPDVEADELGGSVLLSEDSLLSGCERGDFLEVQGELAKQHATDGRLPQYNVSKVQRITP